MAVEFEGLVMDNSKMSEGSIDFSLPSCVIVFKALFGTLFLSLI